MRLAALFSGGKDSTFAIHKARELGHDVVCLITFFPKSQESTLLHHPNMKWTGLQSKTMNIPQLVGIIQSDDTTEEDKMINELLITAISDYDIEGVLHGGIQSNFQKKHFEKSATDLNLQVISPLWGIDPFNYMNELLIEKFKFMVVSVSADGLDDFWLGKIIERNDLLSLQTLSKKFGFNMNFEGGEAETFVVDCPLFKQSISILKSQKIWDGYRGRFEIVEAELKNNA